MPINFCSGRTKTVDLGGVHFIGGVAKRKDPPALSLHAPPFDADRWSFTVSAERCSATAQIGAAKEAGTEQRTELATREGLLRTAEASLAEMDAAVALRNFGAAFSASSAACEARRKALGSDHPLVAECEIAQSRQATAAGKPQDGLALATRAEASLSRLPKSASLTESFAAAHLQARALFFLSKPAEMRDAAQRAFDGRSRILGAGHPETLASQESLAIAFQSLGRLDEAIAMQEVLVRRHSEKGATRPETLRAKVNLSSSLKQRGDIDRVVELQTEVRDGRRAALGDRDPSTLIATHDLGIALVDAGRMDEALPIVTQSIPLFLQTFGEEDAQTLRIKTLLGVIYDRLGRSDESLQLYTEVHLARRRILGEAHEDTANAAYNEVFALLVLDRPVDALRVADESLARMPVRSNRVAATETGLLTLRAEALLRSGEPAKSLGAYETQLSGHALTVEEARRATRRQLEIGYGWSQAQFALGNGPAAIEPMEAMYRAARERFGPDHAIALDFMSALARMLAESGKTDEAEALLAEFLEINERLLREGVSTSAVNRGRLAIRVGDRADMAGYRTYVRLLAARDPQRALVIAERTKARSLTETLARPHIESARLKAARMRFARADERVAEFDIGSAQYLKAVSERTIAEEELRGAIGPGTRSSVPLDVRETLKRVLAPGSVFIEYVVSNDRVLAIVATPQARIVARDLGTIPGLADTVEAYRRVTTSVDPSSERLWSLPDGSIRWSLSQPKGAARLVDLDGIGARLSARLLEPIARDIAGARTWIISPDGALAFLPFEALKVGRQLVLDSKSVAYAPSLSSLARMPARVTTDPPWDFLGVGVSRFQKGSPWRDLPRAEAEVNTIGELFRVARVLVGTQVTEDRMRALDTSGELRRYRFVHFATHAFLSDRGTSLSGVVLSGADSSAGDGVITAAEWPTYRLDSDLVVLSACDTGLGRLVVGEGVVGLPSALLSAGTRAVILTLWSVADESAAEFMPRFYKRLKAGKSPAEALRETKLEFARSKGPYSSPRHWAPYVLYGAP